MHKTLGIFFSLTITMAAATTPLPSAESVLALVRLQQTRQDFELRGELRENDLIVPFRLTQAGPVVRYSFENPAEALQLRLGEKESRLETVTNVGVDRISGPEFEQKVRGTAITYEDLSLRFLYWPTARVLGDDYINTRRVWKLGLEPPGRQSQYSRVFLWCEQKSGALLRMEGFDWNGKLSRRFEVVSVQEIEGRYFLKQMRIEELNPENGKTRTRTYLELKK